MTGFVEWLQGIARSVRPWITVNPWEQGIRVRLGRFVRLLGAGIYVKLPGIDTAFVVPTRVRVVAVPMQTVMSRDGRAVSVAIAFQYQIVDVERVFRSVHHPEATIAHWAQGIIGEAVRRLDADEVTPERIREEIEDRLDLASMGFGAFRVYVTDLALVRTYRLLQEGRWVAGDTLDQLSRAS